MYSTCCYYSAKIKSTKTFLISLKYTRYTILRFFWGALILYKQLLGNYCTGGYLKRWSLIKIRCTHTHQSSSAATSMTATSSEDCSNTTSCRRWMISLSLSRASYIVSPNWDSNSVQEGMSLCSLLRCISIPNNYMRSDNTLTLHE